MKNIKYIPALALIVLLSACNGSRQATVKEPKFAKLGNEVEFEVWRDGLQSEGIYGDFGNEVAPSFTFKYNSNEKNVTKVKEGKKVISSQESKAQFLYDIKYDSKNLRATMKEDAMSDSKVTAEGQNKYTNMDMAIDMGYQICKVEDKDSLVVYEKSLKEYDVYQDVSEMTDEQRKEKMNDIAFDLVGENFMTSYIDDVIDDYPSLDAETRAYYKFYKNGDVYTLKFTRTSESDYTYMDVKYYELTTVYEDCVQFEKTKKGLNFKSSEVSKKTVTFLEKASFNGLTYKAGQVLQDESYEYYDNALVSKDVTIKEVDISKYSKGMSMI